MKVNAHVMVLASGAAAFPSALDLTSYDSAKRQIPGIRPGLSTTFDEEAQFISTTGVNAFVPPNFAAGDQRGPCPGLNALANHGYLPHNGIGNIAQFTAATNQVYGLALDVASAFAVYGAVVAGDGESWSIGGPPSGALSSLAPGLIGRPKGISFSHNEYEGDGSATRDDFYLAGDDYKLNMEYFRELYDILPADSFTSISNHRNTRVQESVNTNPYYFNGPFTGVAIAGGATNFVFRLAANHSKEYPQGYLDKNTFASFWGVFGDSDDTLEWKEGWDRIPDNWYRRSHDDEYSIPFVAEDLAQYYVQHPESARIGGNTGKVNSFVGVDVENATGGVYNVETLAQGNNLACFAYQVGALGAPDLLAPIFADITGPLQKLTNAFNTLLAPLDCPVLEQADMNALKAYPGAQDPEAHE